MDRRGSLGLRGEVDEDVVLSAIEGDPGRVADVVNDGGPTTEELCSAINLWGGEVMEDVYLFGCRCCARQTPRRRSLDG